MPSYCFFYFSFTHGLICFMHWSVVNKVHNIICYIISRISPSPTQRIDPSFPWQLLRLPPPYYAGYMKKKIWQQFGHFCVSKDTLFTFNKIFELYSRGSGKRGKAENQFHRGKAFSAFSKMRKIVFHLEFVDDAKKNYWKDIETSPLYHMSVFGKNQLNKIFFWKMWKIFFPQKLISMHRKWTVTH